jgi:hypothetical protein
MRIVLGIILGLTLVAAVARAQEVTVVRDVLGPEGPQFVDGKLYFVAWTTGSLSKWDGKTTTVLNSRPGCSHNGLALTRQKTFLLACTDAHGAILELDLKGKEMHHWDADDKGNAFTGGSNQGRFAVLRFIGRSGSARCCPWPADLSIKRRST